MIEAHKETISLKNAVNGLEETLLKLKSEQKVSVSKLADTKSSLEFQTSLNGELKAKVDQMQTEISDLNKKIKEPEEIESVLVKQLKKQIDERENDVQSLNEFCDEVNNDAERLKNEQKKWETENNNLSVQIEKMKVQRGDWEKQKKSLTDEIEDLKKLHGQGEKEIKKMEKNLLEAINKSEELKKLVESSNLSRAAAEKELHTVYQLQGAKNLATAEKDSAETEEVDNNNQSRVHKICLFELKTKGLCRRKNKCKFLHDISDAERGDVEFVKQVIVAHAENMNFCPVELVEKGSCNPENCRFNHSLEDSTLRKRPGKKESRDAVTKQICFKEAEGKCPRGVKCFFSHEISEAQKKNPEFLRKIKEEREQRQGLCVNEYAESGSCHKKQSCKFNHNITEEQRSDKRIKERMQEKLKQLQGGRACRVDDQKSRTQIAESIRSTISHQMEVLIFKALNEISNPRCF